MSLTISPGQAPRGVARGVPARGSAASRAGGRSPGAEEGPGGGIGRASGSCRGHRPGLAWDREAVGSRPEGGLLARTRCCAHELRMLSRTPVEGRHGRIRSPSPGSRAEVTFGASPGSPSSPSISAALLIPARMHGCDDCLIPMRWSVFAGEPPDYGRCLYGFAAVHHKVVTMSGRFQGVAVCCLCVGDLHGPHRYDRINTCALLYMTSYLPLTVSMPRSLALQTFSMCCAVAKHGLLACRHRVGALSFGSQPYSSSIPRPRSGRR